MGGCPRHQASLRTRLNISDDLELDMWIRYVDTSQATYVSSDSGWYDVDDYITVDMRVGWHITKALDLDIVCNNLLDETRVEFAQEAFSRVVEVDRSIYAKLTMEF